MARLIALAVLVTATAAAAETRWGLRWRAPDDCISPAQLSQAAEERLGRSVFGANAQMQIDGVIQRATAPSKWRAKFTVVDASGSIIGSRELLGEEESCRALDAKLALVLALIIDPKADARIPPPGSATVHPPAEDGVFIHLEVNDSRVRLFRFLGGSYGTVQTGNGSGSVYVASFSDECGAPCDAVIKRPGDRFFIGGDGITMSSELKLNGQGGALDLKVNPGSAWLRWGGFMLVTVGLAGVVCGAIFLAIGSALKSTSSSSLFNGPMPIALLAGGGAVGAIGIPMIIFSSTKVELVPRGQPATTVVSR